MRKLSCLLATILIVSASASAQDPYPSVEMFGGFSWMNTGGGLVRRNRFGWQASVEGNVTRKLGLVGDFGGQYRTIDSLTGNVSTSLYEYLFGPQLSFRAARTTAFAHAMLGGTRQRATVLGTSISRSGFAMGFGGGVDFQVTKTIAFRAVQFDYIPNHAGGVWGHNVRLGTGVGFTFGGR